MATVTAFILTFNEEEMLPLCLDRLKWADEILVLDSGSTDRTVELAKAAGARVEYHPFSNFAEQCNQGLDRASCDWILQIDADELVTPELAASVQRTVSSQPCEEIFSLCRDACAWGRFMKASSWSGDWIPRLFRKGAVQFAGEVHQDPQVNGRPVGKLDGKLLHYSYRSAEQFFKKSEFYSTLWAIKARSQGRRTGIAGAVTSSLWRMFHNYFIRGEIRDGKIGFVMAILAGMHTFTRHIKLWGLQNEEEFARVCGYDGKDAGHGDAGGVVKGGGTNSGGNGSTGVGGGGEG